jgi:riboflavin biosynthesis pyrimidine reductase
MGNTSKQAASTDSGTLSTDDAWTILLALAARAKAGNALTSPTAIGLVDGQVEIDAADKIILLVDPAAPRSWSWGPAHSKTASAEVAAMLDIYMPLCVGCSANSLVVAHLGQSLDGRIATQSGVSQFITGDENLVHTHRLRALFDAVLVGANTASMDNPRLTTRRASGDHATRVLCDSAFAPANHKDTHIALPTQNGLMDPAAIIAALHMLGLKRIFVEGGGVTVSQFLEAGALDRLHVCIAPMIIGSGRPAFRLPEVDNLGDCIYLDVQHFSSGADLLFDCQLRAKE